MYTHEGTFKLRLFLLENHHFNEEVQRKCGRKIQITVLHSKRKIVQYFVSFANNVMQNH